MRILDFDNDKSLKNIVIYLEVEEAKELFNSLKFLIEKNDPKNHVHVNDKEYKHEITMLTYDENDLSSLNERSKQLIEQDI